MITPRKAYLTIPVSPAIGNGWHNGTMVKW